MSIKDVTEIYSPIVATLALAWAVIAHFRDSRKLVITFVLKYQTFFGRITKLEDGRIEVSRKLLVTEIQGSVGAGKSGFMYPTVGNNNGDFLLTISLINAGKRPITVRRWGIVNVRKLLAPYIIPDSWETFEHPARIEESATFEFKIDSFSTLKPDQLTDGSKKFVVEDTHGRIWELSGGQLRTFALAFRHYESDVEQSKQYASFEMKVFETNEEFLKSSSSNLTLIDEDISISDRLM